MVVANGKICWQKSINENDEKKKSYGKNKQPKPNQTKLIDCDDVIQFRYDRFELLLVHRFLHR